MGTVGKDIFDIDRNELIKMLNKALSEEWLAYVQYFMGSKIVSGKGAAVVEAELLEHAQEELEHAEKLIARILQLEGVPVTNPKNWFELAGCAYEDPKDPSTFKLLEQNIDGERCAIKSYNAILKFVEGKDPITYRIILEILEDEIEHEDDLEKIFQDLKASN